MNRILQSVRYVIEQSKKLKCILHSNPGPNYNKRFNELMIYYKILLIIF